MNSPAIQTLFSAAGWLNNFITWCAIFYLLGARFLGREWEVFRTTTLELKPLFWPTAFLTLWDTMARTDLTNFDKGWAVAGILVGWYLIKRISEDDDRWKRRREKLLEKVSAVGGRLVITPA